jgi:N-acetylglucosaminyl-diphospho-decaprenol L-rhamnosyltransferase
MYKSNAGGGLRWAPGVTMATLMTAPVTVAVVSWNTLELLRACLRSLEPEAQAGRATVWVVDNASSDGSAEMVRSEFPSAQLLASADNLGFGPAVNLVAERTASPWLAIANADTELFPGSLEELLAAGRRHPRAGILAPRLVLGSGETQHSAYKLPRLGFTLAFNLGVYALSHRLASSMLLEGYWPGDRERRVGWALGAFLLVRREAWDAAGGFDPGQWMYAEDVDLGWRVEAAGWETWFVPGAPVRHHGAAATSQLWGDERDVRWQRSTYAWMLRRRGLLATRAYGVVNTLGAAARVALYALPLGRPGLRAERRRASAHWLRLHLVNLTASRSTLEAHR